MLTESKSAAAGAENQRTSSREAAKKGSSTELQGKEKLDFLLKQTELFTQFILMQGRGIKLSGQE